MPFDVLELALLKGVAEEKQEFFFVQIGADKVMNGPFRRLIRQYDLQGCALEPITDVDSLLARLPDRHVSILCVSAEGSDDKIIDAAFRAGVFPPIINYEWTEMPVERRCELKLKLLDHGYRFVDIGSDTVCLRVDHARSHG